MNPKVFNELSKEALSIMLKMRRLIFSEFGVLLSLHETDAAANFHQYGCRSRQPELVELAEQLAEVQGLSPPSNEDVKVPENPVSVDSPATATSSTPTTSSHHYYRGQPLKEKPAISQHDHSETVNKEGSDEQTTGQEVESPLDKAKSRRVYRGRVIKS